MSVPAIELDGVSLAFRDTPVLEDVNLRVEANDYLAILGPNGCGKTTLLKVILGLLRPDRGRVLVQGRRPEKSRGTLGYVPQHARFDLDFPIRVIDVVRMGRLAARPLFRPLGDADHKIAQRELERLEIADLALRPIGSLSGGQLQRVLIARALTLEPKVLLLDEPTASLDERIGVSVFELLKELSQEMTVVLVTHDIGAISQSVRNVACLNRTLHCHPTKELTSEILEATYGCPVELLAHGQPHRVLGPHGDES